MEKMKREGKGLSRIHGEQTDPGCCEMRQGKTI